MGLVAEDGLESPWTYPDKKIQSSLQARNRLIVRLLLTFGLRRGDLLKLYTTDALVSGSSKVLRVRRRPDDPMDSRRSEPNVKTQERDLPLSNALASELDIYVRIARLSIPGARRSPYLFLDVKRGCPLSLRALNDVFNPLRKIFPRLHPHVCRHTCNELILQESDANGISRSRALKHMRYINGWLGDNSGVYTRRLVREEARALSLDMQHRLFTLEKFDPKNNEK